MKIVLIRHFKVNLSFPKKYLLSKQEVIDWFDKYNTADVESELVNLSNTNWTHCYSSPLKRAKATAEIIYKGEITETDALKELDILHLLPEKVRLPFLVWGLLVQIKFYSGAKEVIQFRHNLDAFIEKLITTEGGNVLIVSHGFVMLYIQKQLLKKGFRGHKIRFPENGILYGYERV